MIPGLSEVEALDAADPLRAMRDLFHLPSDVIYLDGNSLGPAPKSVFAELERTARQEWAEGLIRSWNTAGWFTLTDTLGDRVGRLIGAEPGETVVTDTTSINVYKALHAALSLRPDRATILAEADSFPTDLYMAEGVAASRAGVTLRLAPSGTDLEVADRRPNGSGADQPCRLSHRYAARYGRLDQAGARGGRPRRLGSLPQRRRAADRIERGRCRLRHRLHLQISERRSRGSGLHLRRPPPSRSFGPAPLRLVGACPAIRDGEPLPSRLRHSEALVRHPADPVAERAQSRARRVRTRRTSPSSAPRAWH